MNSTLLAVRLKEQIVRKGPLSVADYMEACLSDEEAGYYPSRQPIGANGDFVTAPEVSQVFGELIGLWAVAVWQSMGEPESLTVAELGPGRGTLMSDALRAWRSIPAFCDAVSIALVETSPLLRDVQQTALQGADVDINWYTALDAVPGGPLIVIANEFVDALPVRQFVWRTDEWRERCIRIGARGNFTFCDGPAVSESAIPAAVRRLNPSEGSVLETRPATASLVSTMGARAQEAPLAVLIVDYGHTEAGFGDTLQAVSRHAFANPLSAPGDVDLTAHVDFATLRDDASDQGLRTYGPIAQADLLLQLGIETRRDALCENATPEQANEIVTGTNRLTDASAMGVLFKALAMASDGLPPPPAFEHVGDHARTRP